MWSNATGSNDCGLSLYTVTSQSFMSNPSDEYWENTRRRSAGEDGPMGHAPQVKDNTYTIHLRLEINQSTLQFRMKKLGIVGPGHEADASVASEAQWALSGRL